MDQAADHSKASTLHDYIGILRRRKWMLIPVTLLVPITAVALSLRQERLYQAEAEVLLNRENVAAALTGVPQTAAGETPERFAETQAEIARVPAVARATLDSLGLRRSVEQFLERSSVATRPNADILSVRATDPVRRTAQQLATRYAQEFARYRRALDTQNIATARRQAEKRLRQLERAGDRRSTLYTALVQKTQELSTMEALKTSTASVIHPAAEANQVQPRPVRNGMLGLALGLVLGFALALLRDALDTRVRGADEVSTRLQLPLLARLPAPPRKRRARDSERLVMLSGPYGEDAEPYRMLRTNLEFVNLNRGARDILFTSAVEREGKSTTVANLAILLARTGKHVVLVDLDLRRPYLDRVFGLVDSPGVTDVALGHAQLSDATARIRLERPGIAAPTQASGQEDRGSLRVLPSGSLPPDPGDFVASDALERILREVGEGADIVLIDAPPLLHVGDAMTLSDKVDGVIVVVRLNLIRRQTLGELHRVLEGMPAAKLGFVLTGAGRDERYGYGGYYYQSRPVLQRPALQLEDAARAGESPRARRRAAREAR